MPEHDDLYDTRFTVGMLPSPFVNLAYWLSAHLPCRAPCENAALLGALLLRHTFGGAERVAPYVTTATDVLRLAVALPDRDFSLATPTTFRRLARPEGRLLRELLERCGSITEDMLRRPEPWKRLGERLHPNEYQPRFPRAATAFDVIRNDRPFPTFNRRIESPLARSAGSPPGAIHEALTLLVTRQSELARW